MKSHLALACLWIVLGAFAGCGKAPDAHLPASAPGSHIHVAPHGGTLVPLGEHAYNLELVRDADTGCLSLYVLDGHAENFIRITAPTIELVAIAGGERRPLNLRAVANSATGETVGDTSQFDGQADWLKKIDSFPGEILGLDLRETKFEKVAFYFRS